MYKLYDEQNQTEDVEKKEKGRALHESETLTARTAEVRSRLDTEEHVNKCPKVRLSLSRLRT